jgi:hypothetical protein
LNHHAADADPQRRPIAQVIRQQAAERRTDHDSAAG